MQIERFGIEQIAINSIIKHNTSLGYVIVVHIEDCISFEDRSNGQDLPGELTCRFPALIICRVHRPSAFSPQKCTLRKGQSSKLELRTSRGRSNSRVDVVPIGEVSSSLKFPRGKNLKETYFMDKTDARFMNPVLPRGKINNKIPIMIYSIVKNEQSNRLSPEYETISSNWHKVHPRAQ